jgi:hypothetical protein
MSAKVRLPNVNSRDLDRVNYAGVTNSSNSKLRKMANRFEGFEEELTLAKQMRLDENEKRLQHLQKQIDDTKSSIALEAQNRSMSMNALQSWLSDRIDKWTINVETPILEKIRAVNASIDAVNKRMAELEAEHQTDRIEFPKLIDARCNELLVEIRDMKHLMEQNVKEREEKEQKIMVKIQNNDDKVLAMFQAEKALTEKKLMALNQDIGTEVHTRRKGYDTIKQNMFDANVELKASLEKETQERERAYEEVLQAVAHYSSALQDGVKIVGL